MIPFAKADTACFGILVSSLSINMLLANPNFSIQDSELFNNISYSLSSAMNIKSDFFDGCMPRVPLFSQWLPAAVSLS